MQWRNVHTPITGMGKILGDPKPMLCYGFARSSLKRRGGPYILRYAPGVNDVEHLTFHLTLIDSTRIDLIKAFVKTRVLMLMLQWDVRYVSPKAEPGRKQTKARSLFWAVGQSVLMIGVAIPVGACPWQGQTAFFGATSMRESGAPPT
ncbi:hypothetical protein TNCV_4429101 [Trichonephila clavipes]|nr:hypothetical protein TNCV_4429101 [Trichonephila clavipes]